MRGVRGKEFFETVDVLTKKKNSLFFKRNGGLIRKEWCALFVIPWSERVPSLRDGSKRPFQQLVR